MAILKLIEIFSAWRKGRVLRKRLKPLDFGEISWKSTTGSTNQDLMLRAQTGRNHFSVAIADHQTAGKGREQRQWISEKGTSLLMSVRFEVDLVSDPISLYSMKLSVSVVRALEKFGFSEIKIKWPNDLMVGERKLAGLLPRLIHRGSKIRFARIGLGLNVCNRAPKGGISLSKIPGIFKCDPAIWTAEVLLAIDRATVLAEKPEFICLEAERRLG